LNREQFGGFLDGRETNKTKEVSFKIAHRVDPVKDRVERLDID